ncbi:DUF4259 domain-containing protein [Actinomadura formosensis]|uniref:DUF4259 domain-containing protein n=1 Tax=Actinomadura formosensis TaxID=60706 RepID=UPI000A00E413|nr:DUF4259 domain-containing protein [Actinomadura formosensis]
MGAWGSGPFDSDTAEDFVDDLERLASLQRLAVLERVFHRAIDAAESEKLPAEVVAAAAVVAANLPSGASLSWNEDYPGISEWLPKPIAFDLTVLARRALDVALPVNGWFWQSWVDIEERREAESVVNILKSILSDR